MQATQPIPCHVLPSKPVGMDLRTHEILELPMASRFSPKKMAIDNYNSAFSEREQKVNSRMLQGHSLRAALRRLLGGYAACTACAGPRRAWKTRGVEP